MRLRRLLITFVVPLACGTTSEGGSAEVDGSSGLAETDTEATYGSSGGSDPDPSSDPAGEPTSAGSTTGTDQSSGTTEPAGSTSDPATSGSSGAAETSADESGGDDGPSAQCVELEACCDQIGSALFGGCISVVQMDSPELCDSILTNYHQEGYCTGETYCAELGDCCAELPPGPGWQETCEYYADFGNQPQCAMLIGDYQLSDYCF